MTVRVVVLGSNAFSASHFVAHALNQGAEVLGINRSAEPGAAFLPYRQAARASSYRFLQLDLNQDLSRILEEIQYFAPDYVADFAGQGMVAESWQDPAQWFQTNVLSKVKLHEGLRHLKGLKKYIRISTPEVYGSTSGAVSEGAPPNPSTPYAVTHAAIDLSLRTYFQRYGFPVVLTRSSNFYGPGQQLYRIIPRAILCALRGEKLPLHGGGHAIRNFLYIDDFCEAAWKVMTAAPVGELYHVASEEYLSIRQVVQRIADLMAVSFDDLVEIAEDRPSKDAAYYLDTAKLRGQLGWAPTVPLEEGLRRTVAWAKAHAGDLAGQSLAYVHKA